MNGADLDGRKIRVDFSITKRPHTPTPGMYMGRPTTGKKLTSTNPELTKEMIGLGLALVLGWLICS